MQTRILLLVTLLFPSFWGFSQSNENLKSVNSYAPKLKLDFMLVDAPYIKYAAQATANYKANVPISNSADVDAGHYVSSALGSPSMAQVVSFTSSFYNTMNFGIAKGWNKMVNPHKSRRSKFFNAFGSEFTAAVGFVLTTKVPFAGGWAHEEFHRNTWTPMGIGSYDLIWQFDLAPDALTYVGSIYDEDLAAFKQNDPAGFVRMGSAGIEAQYLISERVQTQDFLYKTQLPNLALYLANFVAAIDYVNRAHTIRTIDEHSENYVDQPNQLKRDFTGNDFTAWVYDLYNSSEPYYDRGVHPTGIGVDRYRDYNDLSKEMLSYVEKIGNRQWLNVVNPFMVRFREFKLNSSLGFNIAMRHHLTSFGDDSQLDLFINRNQKKSVITLHKYSNHDRATYPGLEIANYGSVSPFNMKNKLTGNVRAMAWIQPKNQAFFTNKGSVGGLVSFRAAYDTNRWFEPYIELEAKTAGWVAGVPYLKGKTSARFGFHTSF